MLSTFTSELKAYATTLTGKFSIPGDFNPEDQLKGPVATLLQNTAGSRGLTVTTATEAQVKDLGGRPDLGVSVNGLLCGYVELKRPGKGANTNRFRGRDRDQWHKFQDLPNILYTDGNEWCLYRSGEREGKIVRLSGDVTTEGAGAVSSEDASELLPLVRDFLNWDPIVPHRPRPLAQMLAPLCRLLRSDVAEVLKVTDSGFVRLADDWRKYFFPDADDQQFADAYAQTITYSLLLARLQGAEAPLNVTKAVQTIRPAHELLSEALDMLTHPDGRGLVDLSITLLERVIGAIDPVELRKMSKGDPWLYFYEDFLAEYDPKLRKNRGVYYTPVEVVQAQVRLVAHLLNNHFEADFSFASAEPQVVTLDPAAGTGTYIMAALEHALEQVESVKGPGVRAGRATQAAKNIYGFELLVGPYAVAHMRFTQQVQTEGGSLPEDGTHVYLADTLESPNESPKTFPFAYKALAEEHERARRVKAEAPVLVCIGNPPYDRQQISLEEAGRVERKGGWVRYGDRGSEEDAILQDFIKPLERINAGVHAKNLYNDYVYFWRWALWKVFEQKAGGGIISFITASSYLRGPGFAGMRQMMRKTFDELWIIDLEGDNLGARKTDNVFAIRTPVCIAVGVRYDEPKQHVPATVHYTRLAGTAEEKLRALAGVYTFADLSWRDCLAGWTDVFLPTSDKAYWDWPLVTDLFPWQENGVQFKRTWPISESAKTLRKRWQTLLAAARERKRELLKETGARRIDKKQKSLDKSTTLPAIADLDEDTPVQPTRYAYRSFDRQWAIQDVRLCDRPRPTLQMGHGEQQIYLTSLLTKVLGEGSSAVATSLLPDMDHFSGRGAKDVIPLWRNPAATIANVTNGVLQILENEYETAVTPKDFFAYTYAVLATPGYVERFWDELTIPGPRLPVTRDPILFARGVDLGRQLLYLHTYGERFVPEGEKPGRVPRGQARVKVGTPTDPARYPDDFRYDAKNRELHVGDGLFSNVRPEVWEFSVSGLEVVQSWLGYRMKNRKGRSSSPLDEIRPEQWTFDEELLDLLWVLEGTIALLPAAGQLLDGVMESELFLASEFPEPAPAERDRLPETLPLFQQGKAGEKDET